MSAYSLKSKSKSSSITIKILTLTLFNLICYINVGMPFAAVPLYVNNHLGFNSIVAGMAVSMAYISTFLTRPGAGKWMDIKGAKSAVIIGLLLSATGGILTFIASILTITPYFILIILFLGRFCTGASESWASTAVNLWNIQRVSVENATQVISWNGVTSYGGMAIGAPLGIFLSHLPGFWGGLHSIAILTTLLAVLSTLIIYQIPAIPPKIENDRLPFAQVFAKILPVGTCLCLGTIGFGSIQAFIALYFVFNHWTGSAYAISIFGFCFIMVRFIFKNMISIYGGYIVSIISLFFEAIGLCLIATSHSILRSYIGSGLTGAGLSLVYPALGVIAISKVGAENRGSALAGFSLFLDIALFIAGPLLGTIYYHFGYYWLFMSCSLLTLIGMLLTFVLYYRTNNKS